MRKPKIILFDWDNTLVETGPVLRKTVNSRIDQLNLDRSLLKNTENTKPLTLKERLERLFGDKWEEVWEDCKKDYLEILEAEGGVKTLPGVVEILDAFNQDKIIMALVSNKEKDLLLEEVEQLGLEKYFSAIVGSGDAKEDKPSPLPALLALEKIQKTFATIALELPQDCWFIGDSDLDVTSALAANLLPVIVNDKVLLARNYLKSNQIKHLDFPSLNELLIAYKK
jgi:phosphoglycolate phosphatase